MKKAVLVILSLLLSVCVNGYNSDSLKIVTLQREVNTLKTSILKLQQEDGRLKSMCQQQAKELDSLHIKQQQQAESINTMADKVGADISDANQKIDNNVSTLSESINSRTWLGALGVLIAVALLGVVYWIFRRRTFEIKLAQDEMSVESDTRLTGILNQIVGVQTNILNLNGNISQLQNNSVAQLDHTLALKVADEIVRIETNLSRMDSSVKGYKQLAKAVERIRTNFLANGYEIVEMLGKPYNDGMKVVANFVSDDTLADGEQKITGIIKPQINYKGKMIQSAQITVSQNL